MRLRDEQSGFTVIELVVTSAIGMVVLLALFGLVDTTQSASSTVTQRVDASQRGRTAMEQLSQAIRSVVCAKTDPDASPGVIASGSGSHITVYTAIQGAVAGQAAPTALAPEQREYRFDAVTRARARCSATSAHRRAAPRSATSPTRTTGRSTPRRSRRR